MQPLHRAYQGTHSPNPIVDIMIIMPALEGRIVQQILKDCNEKK